MHLVVTGADPHATNCWRISPSLDAVHHDSLLVQYLLVNNVDYDLDGDVGIGGSDDDGDIHHLPFHHGPQPATRGCPSTRLPQRVVHPQGGQDQGGALDERRPGQARVEDRRRRIITVPSRSDHPPSGPDRPCRQTLPISTSKEFLQLDLWNVTTPLKDVFF